MRNGVMIFSNERGFRVPPEVCATAPTQKVPERVLEKTVVKEVVLVVCPSCNHRNDASRRTCENCGASI